MQQTETFARVKLDKIHPDPDQPRKTFDVEALDELAESIKEHGVVVPIELRPHPTKNHGSFMLVAGERRWRASKLAGVDDIPAMIKSLDAVQALEHQLIENSQREGVPPLEEAEAYQRLMRDHGYSMEQLIAKTKRSKAHLYGRLKLLELAAGPMHALAAGKLAPAIAELIARIPVADLQEQACKEILGEACDMTMGAIGGLGIESECLTPADSPFERGQPQPLSYRSARALIQRRYSLKLKLAPFDTADAELVANAGPCTTCPHRSGNQPELTLPGLETVADDLCTNSPCYAAKTEAAWQIAAAVARERGVEIIEDASRVFAHDGVTVSQTSPYVDLDTELPYDLDATPGSRKTFGKLLGKRVTEAGIARVLVKDGAGMPRELLVKSECVKVLRDAGKIDKPDKPKPGTSSKSSPSSSTVNDGAAIAKEKAKQELKESALIRLLGALSAKVEDAEPGKKETAWWRWIAHALLDHVVGVGEVPEVFFKRRGNDACDVKGLDKEIDACRSAGELRAFVIELLVATLQEGVIYGMRQAKERFDDACDLFGVSFDDEMKKAKDATEIEADIDAAKKRIANGEKKDEKKKAAKKGKK